MLLVTRAKASIILLTNSLAAKNKKTSLSSFKLVKLVAKINDHMTEKHGELQQREKGLTPFKNKGRTYDQRMTEKLRSRHLRKEARETVKKPESNRLTRV